MTALEDATQLDPRLPDAWFWLAVTRDGRGDERAAIPAYREALRLGLGPTKRAQSWAWMASCLSRIGQHAEALLSIDAASKLSFRPAAEFKRIRDDVESRARLAAKK